MAVDKNKFSDVTKLVIDKLEGGYYSPQWHSTGDSRYSSSGETMFGIDRKQGGAINDSIAGKQFWGLIDKNKNIQTWKWNYKGGELAPQLKVLVVEMMYPLYEKNSKAYLTPEAKTIVDSDNRLLFNFVYATWNGAGWFKKFASDINKAVDNGVKSTDALAKIAIDSRTKEGLIVGSKPNSLIAQGGNKISLLFETLKSSIGEVTDTVKKKPIALIITVSLLIISSYLLYTNIIKK